MSVIKTVLDSQFFETICDFKIDFQNNDQNIYLKPFPSGQEMILFSSEFCPLLSFKYWKCFRTSILVGSLFEGIHTALPMRKLSPFLEFCLTGFGFGFGLGTTSPVGPSGRPRVDRPSFISTLLTNSAIDQIILLIDELCPMHNYSPQYYKKTQFHPEYISWYT